MASPSGTTGLLGSGLSLLTPRLVAFLSIIICSQKKNMLKSTAYYDPNIFDTSLSDSGRPLNTFHVNWWRCSWQGSHSGKHDTSEPGSGCLEPHKQNPCRVKLDGEGDIDDQGNTARMLARI